MSEELKLGQIITTPQHRDAIHIAVVPVKAAETLKPGQHASYAHGQIAAGGDTIGVVDPYLRRNVRAGEQCWLFLYPGSITSLRHEWTHPALPDTEKAPQGNASERWLRELAESVGISYGRLLEGAEDWVSSSQRGGWGDYIIGGSEMEGTSVPDEFWTHYENVTGKQVAEEHRGSFFSCSC